MQAVEAAGEKLGVQLFMMPAQTVEDFDGAFATMTRERVDGFLVVASNLSVSQRALLAEFALKYRLGCRGCSGPGRMWRRAVS
jgi:hypothetical protein